MVRRGGGRQEAGRGGANTKFIQNNIIAILSCGCACYSVSRAKLWMCDRVRMTSSRKELRGSTPGFLNRPLIRPIIDHLCNGECCLVGQYLVQTIVRQIVLHCGNVSCRPIGGKHALLVHIMTNNERCHAASLRTLQIWNAHSVCRCIRHFDLSLHCVGLGL